MYNCNVIKSYDEIKSKVKTVKFDTTILSDILLSIFYKNYNYGHY